MCGISKNAKNILLQFGRKRRKKVQERKKKKNSLKEQCCNQRHLYKISYKGKKFLPFLPRATCLMSGGANSMIPEHMGLITGRRGSADAT